MMPAAASAAGTAPEITNLTEIAAHLKLARFKSKKFQRKIKVAVFDNQFFGHEAEIGKALPENTKYHAGAESPADRRNEDDPHGTMMARIIAQILKSSGAQTDYELHLFKTFGHTKFAAAVEYVVKEQFDLVLHAQVWEDSGNGDGKGYINTEVNKATAAGIVWINASGNYGKQTRWNKVEGKADGGAEWVVFQDKKGKSQDGVTITCTPPKGDSYCKLRLILAWLDFKDDIHTGTDKDLDLFLYDSMGKEIAKDTRNQVLTKDLNNDNSSILPRERVEHDIPKGTFKARVKIISRNFSASNDQLRITVAGRGASLVDPSEGETVFAPADNPKVITVGASDDTNSSWSVKHGKPDVKLKSVIKLKDRSYMYSSSIASAFAAGVSALHLGIDTDRAREDVLTKLKTIGSATPARAAATPSPAAKTTTEPRTKSKVGPRIEDRKARVDREDCLVPTPLPSNYPNARALIARGGVGVIFRNRNAILVPFNFPRSENITVPRGSSIFVYPGGIQVADSAAAASLPRDTYEVIPSYGSLPPVCRSRRRAETAR